MRRVTGLPHAQDQFAAQACFPDEGRSRQIASSFLRMHIGQRRRHAHRLRHTWIQLRQFGVNPLRERDIILGLFQKNQHFVCLFHPRRR